jgi:hypothetical protein
MLYYNCQGEITQDRKGELENMERKKERILKAIDEIGQMSADMRYKVNNDDLNLNLQIDMIKNLLLAIESKSNKRI